MEIQNVNPTILSFAQLPSRRQQKRGSLKDRPEYVYDGILSMRHSGAPWGRNSYDEAPDDSPWPSEEDGDDSSLTEEPIDEQEIYGKDCLPPPYVDRHRPEALRRHELRRCFRSPSKLPWFLGSDPRRSLNLDTALATIRQLTFHSQT